VHETLHLRQLRDGRIVAAGNVVFTQVDVFRKPLTQYEKRTGNGVTRSLTTGVVDRLILTNNRILVVESQSVWYN